MTTGEKKFRKIPKFKLLKSSQIIPQGTATATTVEMRVRRWPRRKKKITLFRGTSRSYEDWREKIPRNSKFYTIKSSQSFPQKQATATTVKTRVRRWPRRKKKITLFKGTSRSYEDWRKKIPEKSKFYNTKRLPKYFTRNSNSNNGENEGPKMTSQKNKNHTF